MEAIDRLVVIADDENSSSNRMRLASNCSDLKRSMTAARWLHDEEGDLLSQIGAPGRRSGGGDGADSVFQPSNGDVTQTIQAPERPGRFTSQLSAPPLHSST